MVVVMVVGGEATSHNPDFAVAMGAKIRIFRDFSRDSDA
jgi:hypothetical protein